MKCLIVVAALVATCYCRSLSFEEEFGIFTTLYGKSYSTSEEELVRKLIFQKNLQIIIEHNKLADQGLKSYRLGINEFADLENHEFVRMMNGFRMETANTNQSEKTTFIKAANVELPSEVDWVKQGAVTEIKNQGQCGSCWSFSTTGSLEGQMFRKSGTLVSFSEQQLVDCSRKYGNQGCNGGLMENAFDYIMHNGGIDTESCYPYQSGTGIDSYPCRYKESCNSGDVTGHTEIPSGDEDSLKSAVATVGPISVAIDASHSSFQLYSSGVYDEERCSSSRLDHGVLAVGYGTMEGKDYWKVKNSWGRGWGSDGYIMMSRNKDNQCGIATQACYPRV